MSSVSVEYLGYGFFTCAADRRRFQKQKQTTRFKADIIGSKIAGTTTGTLNFLSPMSEIKIA
jgi:hypothetical protein